MSTKLQFFETNNGGRSFGNQTSTAKLGQGFKHTAQAAIEKISLLLYKIGSPTDNITCEIWSDNGSNLPNAIISNGSATPVAMGGITTNSAGAWYDFVFPTKPSISANTQYHIVLGRSGALNNGNNPVVKIQTTGGYANGELSRYDSGTSIWVSYGGDANFQVWGGLQLKIVLKTKYNMGGKISFTIKTRYNMGIKLRSGIKTKYNIGLKFYSAFRTKYSLVDRFRKTIKTKYHATTMRAGWLMRTKYHFTRIAAHWLMRSKYNDNPAIVGWYDANDVIKSSLVLRNLLENAISNTVELHLWNSKEIGVGVAMFNCKLTARLSNGQFSGGTITQGQEVVDGKWIEAKSNGVSGTGITDDAQTSFTPIGGDPATPGNFLAIGDIPANCARHIHIRVNVPTDPTTSFSAFPELLISYDLQ